jgi:hypothetical protein
MTLKRKHTKSVEAILARISELEFERSKIEEELGELAALIRDHKFNLMFVERDLNRTGIKLAYDNYPGIESVGI